MSDTHPSGPDFGRDLGNIITNARVRRAIYGTYVITCVVSTAFQVGLAAVQIPQPAPLAAGMAVLAYLAIPVGGLALANTAPTAAAHRPKRRRARAVRPASARDTSRSIPVTGR
jgi:predicted PurR-regulated permease PerM